MAPDDDADGDDDPDDGFDWMAVPEDDPDESTDDPGREPRPSTDDREPTPEPSTDDREPSSDAADGGSTPGASTDAGDRRPAPEPSAGADEDRGPVGRFLHSEDPVVATVREVLGSVGTVVLIGLVLFGLSGVWPPLVAVESGSMEPHMHKGDLVFVMEAGRFSPGSGDAIVTHREGTESGYWSFGDYGNVVVYEPDGQDGTPIIHRAMFHVEEGDNWVAMANDSYLGGIDSCADISSCPAEHDGYVTKGDHNRAYDQAVGRSDVVRARWIRGIGKVRVPYLGCVRLELAGNSCFA